MLSQYSIIIILYLQAFKTKARDQHHFSLWAYPVHLEGGGECDQIHRG